MRSCWNLLVRIQFGVRLMSNPVAPNALCVKLDGLAGRTGWLAHLYSKKTGDMSALRIGAGRLIVLRIMFGVRIMPHRLSRI